MYLAGKPGAPDRNCSACGPEILKNRLENGRASGPGGRNMRVLSGHIKASIRGALAVGLGSTAPWLQLPEKILTMFRGGRLPFQIMKKL